MLRAYALSRSEREQRSLRRHELPPEPVRGEVTFPGCDLSVVLGYPCDSALGAQAVPRDRHPVIPAGSAALAL